MLNKFLVAGRMTADPEIQTKGENRLDFSTLPLYNINKDTFELLA